MDVQVAWDRAEFLDRVAGDEGLVREMVAAFADEAPALVEEIVTKLDAGDARGLRYAAHALRGSLLNLSAAAAARVAGAIEVAARAGDLDTARRWLEHLAPEIDRALRAMAG